MLDLNSRMFYYGLISYISVVRGTHKLKKIMWSGIHSQASSGSIFEKMLGKRSSDVARDEDGDTIRDDDEVLDLVSEPEKKLKREDEKQDESIKNFELDKASVEKNFEDELEVMEMEMVGDQCETFAQLVATKTPDFGHISFPLGFPIVDKSFDSRTYLQPCAEIPLWCLEASENISRFCNDTAGANQSNPIGYHMIIPLIPLLSWNVHRKKGLVHQQYQSDTVSFLADEPLLDDKFATVISRAVHILPSFIGYLASSNGLLSDIQAKMDDFLNTAELTGMEYYDYKAGYPKFPPIRVESTILWALEGLNKAIAMDASKYLHFHVVILYSEVFNAVRAAKVRTQIITNVPTIPITLRDLRSSNQIKYIFKERTLVSMTKVYGTVGAVSVSFNSGLAERLPKVLFDSGVYASCSLCISWMDKSKVQFCDFFGWDLTMMRMFSQGGALAFKEHFKDIGAFNSYIEENSTSFDFCLNRMKKAAVFRFGMFLRSCIGAGLSMENTKLLFYQILNIMDEFICKTHCFKTAVNWVSLNCASGSRSCMVQTWRTVLALGGPGGSGKTTFARHLHEGIGMPYEVCQFKKHKVDRGQFSGISMVRFYDEAPQSSGSGTLDIFMNFTDLDAPESRLYKETVAPHGLQFLIAAAAGLTGLPTARQHHEWYGRAGYQGRGDQAYSLFYGQAERRFKFLTFSGPSDFLLPYSKFMKSRYVTVSKGRVISGDGDGYGQLQT